MNKPFKPANKRKQPPLSPGESRAIIRDAGMRQKEVAEIMGIQSPTLTTYLDGIHYSQPFWDKFFNYFGLQKAS